MTDAEKERDAKNRKIVDELRETFSRLTERLTPEVEPAAVYIPALPASDNEK